MSDPWSRWGVSPEASAPRADFTHQQLGTTRTRVRMSGGWHAAHWVAIVFTGGLWAPFYLYKWVKATGQVRETTHS